jgi:hypothetical protein
MAEKKQIKKAVKKAPVKKQEVKKEKTTTLILKTVDMKNVPLGTRMRDKITGFEGIAVAKVVFLNKCVQYQLKPSKLDKDGKVYAGETFDIQQLEIIDEGILEKKAEEKTPTGGDMPDSPNLKNGFF